MGLVFRKTRKIRKSRKSRKQTRRRYQHRKLNKTIQRGGYPVIASVTAATTPRMIIKYIAKSDDTSSYIQLTSGQMNVDMTEEYNLGKLDKEPQLEITGLEPGKRYLLTMTDPDALGKTWTHWVAEITSNSNGAGQLVRPEIVTYAPPNPPKDSGVHHYIFRLYDTSILSSIPTKLKSMSRGDYFAIRLKTIIEGKSVLTEASYTIDSSKIKNKNGKMRGVGNIIGIGLDMLRTFAR
jgi:phosphatidylethanolamine-binding protein (PEBP) family uncharacterized protein